MSPLTNEQLENPCRELLVEMTEHLTNPNRDQEILLFELMANCNELATLRTSSTVLMISADKIRVSGDFERGLDFGDGTTLAIVATGDELGEAYQFFADTLSPIVAEISEQTRKKYDDEMRRSNAPDVEPEL